MNPYIGAIESCIDWIEREMLTFDKGRYGIYERIRIDKLTRTDWSRPDCNCEFARVLLYYKKCTGSCRYDALYDKVINWVLSVQDSDPISAWYGSFPFYVINGYPDNLQPLSLHESNCRFQNDGGKVMILLCQLYEQTEDKRLLTSAERLAEYWLKAQRPDGTFAVKDGKCTYLCAAGPCFVVWLAGGLYRLYRETKDSRYLQAAERSMAYVLTLICEDGRVKTSYELSKTECWRPVSSETAMTLHALAAAYKTTGCMRYREAIDRVGGFLLSLQHPCGGIRNCDGRCDTEEYSLQNNGSLCDLVYTQGYALYGLIEVFSVTKEQKYLDAAKKLAGFLAGIQCLGESTLWDGGWRGSYNVDTGRWDGRANQNNPIDEGGMYSVYTGWCACTIVYGMELLTLEEQCGCE